ncbi:hypothetical protein [Plasmodium yoelii yoelii]|uniref:Uncharacterized protein n=1 Tax=Plasmodium yoelii yoelii TaxID=73239 RepID=Q7RM18_PLAYO|nr:hypothetical protein [Plasmodium yoelii yoelii]
MINGVSEGGMNLNGIEV